jgi:coenzyme F420-reducing hydrogenase beta subunit
MDAYGRYQAAERQPGCGSTHNISLLSVCPFSGVAENEDAIGSALFSDNCRPDGRIGYYLDTYAGFVSEGAYRQNGSSGGMGTWLLTELFCKGLIDGVIHVHEEDRGSGGELLFRYRLSTTLEGIASGAKSRYYPIELSQVIQDIRQLSGRYAIVGVPCFIKAVRLLCRQDPLVRDRIVYCIGLVCGHLKSTYFAEFFGWQCGIEPGQLRSINFRKKLRDGDANKYGIEVVGQGNGHEIRAVRRNADFFGYLWAHGFFKAQACDYCDDVLAETADVTVGDAWLPQYLKDPNGTNIIIVRHPIFREMIEEAMAAGRLKMDRLTPDDIARSQEGGLRHRREGLAYRLYLLDRAGKWRPRKRVQANAKHLSARLKRIHEMRVRLARESHVAFQKAIRAGSFSVFRDHMQRLLEKYEACSNPGFCERLLRRAAGIRSRARSFLRRWSR